MSIDQSARSRAVGVSVQFQDFNPGSVQFLPQQLAVIGQGNTAKTYSSDKYTAVSASEVASKYGFGSPLHLAALQLFPANGDGIGSVPVTIYPLEDAGSAVAATGNIAASGTQTTAAEYIVKINEIESESIVLPVGTTASAAITLFKTGIDAVLKMPMDTGANTGVETDIDLTSKWKGESANDLNIEIVGTEAGVTFTVTQPTGGLVNPDVDDALNLIGTRWETIICNLLNYDDTSTLDKYSTFGEGRWGELVKSPLFVISGTTDDRATRTVITDARKTDRTNALIPVPGSEELSLVVAARACARIAKIANNNPPDGYYGRLTGLTPGDDADQETYTERDVSLKAGSGTTVLVDGEIELNDTITMYHPDGEDNPEFRYVVDIVRLQNVVYNVRLIMESDTYKSAPLLPDNTPTTNRRAKKPKNIITVLGNLATNLGLVAIISDPEWTKERITAEISSTNPKRIDNAFPVKLSGNIEINDNTVYFGFYFGE